MQPEGRNPGIQQPYLTLLEKMKISKEAKQKGLDKRRDQSICVSNSLDTRQNEKKRLPLDKETTHV